MDANGAINGKILPGDPHDLPKIAGLLALEATQDIPLRSLCFGPQNISTLFISMYFGLSQLQSKAYSKISHPISPQSLRRFIHLFQADPTSAAFSFLTMYAIRHHTITDHLDLFNNLFGIRWDDQKHSKGIGRRTIPSPSPLQLIKTHRGPIPIEPTHSNKISHPFHLEPTPRRVGRREDWKMCQSNLGRC